MACPYHHPAADNLVVIPNVPIVHRVVCRREDEWPNRPMFYVGPVVGWSEHLEDAEMFVSLALASAVAAIFPGACVLRAWFWAPHLAMLHPDDAASL